MEKLAASAKINMRKTTRLFILLLIFSINLAFGQEIVKLNDHDLIYVLNNSTLLTEHKTNELTIRIFNVNNDSDTVEKSSSNISQILYIAVSEHGENPKQSLFTYGPLYNLKIIGWTGPDPNDFYIECQYGKYAKRKPTTLMIHLSYLYVVN